MSDNKKYYYLKLKDNFFEDESMIILESMQDGYKYSNILLKMYLRSLKNEGRLMFNDIIPYTPSVLSQIVRHSVGDVEKAISVFQNLGLIEVLDSGAIYITDIQNFIGTSSSEADRKREYRARIDAEKTVQISAVTMDGQMSGQTSDKNPPELEIELEIERELKIDKEKKEPASKKTPKPKISKHKYGEFDNVLLTDDELSKLKEQFSDWEFKIDNLSIYIGSTGKTYKSHYLTLLQWARREKSKPVIQGNSRYNKNPKKETLPDWVGKDIKETPASAEDEDYFKKQLAEMRGRSVNHVDE